MDSLHLTCKCQINIIRCTDITAMYMCVEIRNTVKIPSFCIARKLVYHHHYVSHLRKEASGRTGMLEIYL